MTKNNQIRVDEKTWFQYLEPMSQSLVSTALALSDQSVNYSKDIKDFTFVVFPMAKAYEGFLKQYFRDVGLISQETYLGRRFRIGRALNPDVYHYQRDDEWLYDDLERQCSPELARLLWDTWLECRNRLFHYYPQKSKSTSREDAQRCLNMMMLAMEEATECNFDKRGISVVSKNFSSDKLYQASKS